MIASLLRYISQTIPIWPTDRCCHFCGLVIEPTGQPCEVPSSRNVRAAGSKEQWNTRLPRKHCGRYRPPLCRCQVEPVDFLDLPEPTRSYRAPLSPQAWCCGKLFAGKARVPHRSAHRGRHEAVAERHTPGDHPVPESLHDSYGVVGLVASVMIGSMFGLAARVIVFLGSSNASVASARPARSPCSSS